ncbi:transcription factor bHLH133-like [Amborella trichopoda]|uniref:transcription factor bHLH133-like n=1 Tax=Amborella trichopoda TaxID=13333 RepID=UPI0009C15912|nr:transcription factor bHLH133-like [Amborella trichopoda]|eukprot:XP_011624156.2 transcription factor bHLH133-like [Amborella trichopoda]
MRNSIFESFPTLLQTYGPNEFHVRVTQELDRMHGHPNPNGFFIGSHSCSNIEAPGLASVQNIAWSNSPNSISGGSNCPITPSASGNTSICMGPQRTKGLGRGKRVAECEREWEWKKRKGPEVTEYFQHAPVAGEPTKLQTPARKSQKIGDRITILQQLVSPFGKTDTASVLHEACSYIKHLHEQIQVLSTPYLKGRPSLRGGDVTMDLGSRGLCLVPISSIIKLTTKPEAYIGTGNRTGDYRF